MGDNQCALPNEKFSNPIRVEVLGEKKGGFSLFRKSDSPLTDVPVTFKVLANSDIQVSTEKQTTDITGQAETFITAGKQIGDQYLQIIPDGNTEKAVNIRLTVGAKIYGANQEGYTNEVLNMPVAIKLVDSNTRPLEKVPVFFGIKSEPGKAGSAKVFNTEVQTDENGMAQTFVKLGNATGPYEVSVEVADPDQQIAMRSTTVRLLGIDLWKVILSLAGGIAFLLFGITQQRLAENCRRQHEKIASFLLQKRRHGCICRDYCYSRDPIFISYHGHGFGFHQCRIDQFAAGSRNHFRSQHRYHHYRPVDLL